LYDERVLTKFKINTTKTAIHPIKVNINPMISELVKRLPIVMLDATVLIAGSAFPRWPREVLRHALLGDYTSKDLEEARHRKWSDIES